MYKILAVEDSPAILNLIRMSLEDAGYLCVCAEDGVQAADLLEERQFDLVLLDVMLPGIDGFELMDYIRPLGIPVIFLTAKTDVNDKVKGLRLGAEDYLTKPFETEELLACLRALLRRQEEIVPEELTFEGLSLNLSSCVLSYEGHSVRLSSKEFEMMRLLLSGSGNVIPKETLLLKVWGYDSQAEDNHVEVYISFLRKKLFHIHCPVTIESARRLGYYLKT